MDSNNDYKVLVKKHYIQNWQQDGLEKRWDKGPIDQLPKEFCVLEFKPTRKRNMWTYATCCMSQPEDIDPIELHLFSADRYNGHIELLTAIAHYHVTKSKLNLGHTVNFGRPWMGNSLCDHGLISLPYLDGPKLEIMKLHSKIIHFLWLIPITQSEVKYKKENGLELLEQKMEEANIDYLNPYRASVV